MIKWSGENIFKLKPAEIYPKRIEQLPDKRKIIGNNDEHI